MVPQVSPRVPLCCCTVTAMCCTFFSSSWVVPCSPGLLFVSLPQLSSRGACNAVDHTHPPPLHMRPVSVAHALHRTPLLLRLYSHGHTCSRGHGVSSAKRAW